jgi:lysophospholipase L1-like esterase
MIKSISIFTLLAFTFFGCTTTKVIGRTIQPSYNYDFGGTARAGFTKVSSAVIYNDATGYGFERGADVSFTIRKGDALKDGFVSSQKPFYFSVKVPEGNYNVKITLGDQQGASDVAVRAECRRMMINRLQTKPGEIPTVEFTLHIRDSLIRNSAGVYSKVRLKSRERDYFHWDNKLTLEFNGSQPKVDAIEITPAAANLTMVFLAGNSTEVDQAEEPYTAWGQMLPSFFVPEKVVVANYAESGESLSSFIGERRFEKELSLMKPGDYAFVQFGHNDQKQKGPGIGAFTSFKKDLKYYISEVKKKGAIPVLVTSMQRRSFDSTGRIMETLGDYPEAVRQTAKEENVPLIDLNAMSKLMYEAWGPQESLKAFVHFPANTYPGQTKALADNTHFTPYGAYEISKIIVQGIRNNVPALATFIKPGTPVFNPAHPDSYASFYWPASPSTASVKPDGN